MNMPNFDDGFDLFAPPTPEAVDPTPVKLCDTDECHKLWVLPLALTASAATSCLILWGLFKGVLWLLK